jgi:hypothetical protein
VTAFDLVTRALRLAGVLAAGEEPSDADANDGLSVFNDMLDSWNAQRLAIYTTSTDDFPFVVGQQDYTLGTGGNFNVPRPARIDGISAILIQNPSTPVEVPMNMVSVDQWQNDFPVKNVSGTFPTSCYDGGEFPLRTLRFWPIPAEVNNVRIYSWAALAQAADLTTVIAEPPGYAMAMRYNLAELLAAEFGVDPTKYAAQLVHDNAVKSLAVVKSINAVTPEMTSDLVPNHGDWNYKADLFGIPY